MYILLNKNDLPASHIFKNKKTKTLFTDSFIYAAAACLASF